MSDQKNKTDEKSENCGLGKIPPTTCVSSRCTICQSSHIKEIHDLKKAGHTHIDIAKLIKEKFGEILSPSSLCRHFQSYQKQKAELSARIIKDDLIEEATKQSVHTQNIVKLIDNAFKDIQSRWDSGNLRLDISDLEKLIKLRYQVLAGQDTNESDILAIFQKASNKYGLNLQQGVLFKPSPIQANGRTIEKDESDDGVPPVTQ